MTGEMKRRLAVFAVALMTSAGIPPIATAQSKQGAIKGHVQLNGKHPGNPIIRMGMDPMCAKLNPGRRTVQEAVAARADGALANAFVRVQGTFPPSPAPAGSVLIDQRACIYIPRVVGVRAGQLLQIRNSDPLFHNVHGVSTRGNGFNVAEPTAGMVRDFRFKDEEGMLRVICDVHRWMTAFVGIVNHPYFAVSDTAGNFVIDNVPVGTHTLQIWHERFGILSQTVRVTAGATAAIDFAYTGSEKPAASAVRDFVVSAN